MMSVEVKALQPMYSVACSGFQRDNLEIKNVLKSKNPPIGRYIGGIQISNRAAPAARPEPLPHPLYQPTIRKERVRKDGEEGRRPIPFKKDNR